MSLQGVTVLIVEDDIDAQELLSFTLEQESAEILTATSVEEGLRLLEQFQVDVVLTNMHFPDGSGYELLKNRRLWEQQNGKQPVPIIAVTGSEKETGGEFNFQGWVTKPYQIEGIIQTVAKAVGKG